MSSDSAAVHATWICYCEVRTTEWSRVSTACLNNPAASSLHPRDRDSVSPGPPAQRVGPVHAGRSFFHPFCFFFLFILSQCNILPSSEKLRVCFRVTSVHLQFSRMATACSLVMSVQRGEQQIHLFVCLFVCSLQS